MLTKIWKFIEHNRFTWLGPILGLMIWGYAIGCTPETESPLVPGKMVTVIQLEVDFKTWQAQQEITAIKFEAAGQDLEQQRLNNEKIKEQILSLASGGIPDVSGLMKLLIGGGGMGAILDNIRKRGVLAGGNRKKNV